MTAQVLAGTSGWSYAAWRRSFYPRKLPAAQMLAHYAGLLPTVEINNTFYRMPEEEQFRKWAAETPAGFSFAVKAPRRITHERKLADVDELLERCARTIQAGFGDRLGPLLLQLPPFLRKDLDRLRTFLELAARVARGLRLTFEFRHPSWFDEETYAVLREAGAALCIADAEKLETPFVATASWGYLRLRREGYDQTALGSWATRVAAQRWSTAHVFFKHENAGRGPKLAAAFLDLTGAPAPTPPSSDDAAARPRKRRRPADHM